MTPLSGVVRRRHLVLAAPVVFGALVGGVVGAVLALTSVFCVRDERRWVRAVVAASAVALMAIAAVASVFEGERQITASYATDRGLAASSARLAAVQVAVMIAQGVLTGRRARPKAAAATRGMSDNATAAPETMALATGLVLLVGAAVRATVEPTALGPLAREVADNVDRGAGFGRGVGSAVGQTALLTPAAAMLGALAPFGAHAALVMCGVSATIGVALLGRRWGGPTTGLVAAVLTAVLPSWWGQQLPEALATVGVTFALVLLSERTPGVREAVGAGLLVALGALSRPEVLLVMPLLVVWLLSEQRRRQAATVGIVCLALVMPWQLWVLRTFDTYAPTTSLALMVEAASAPEVRSGVDIGGLAPRSFPAADAQAERAAQRAALDVVGDRGLRVIDPRVLVARVLRTFDLWAPTGGRHERERRSLPYPGGTVGGYLEALAMLAAGATWWRAKRGRGALDPLVALPVLAVGVAALSFGDRANRVVALPATTVLVALGLVAAAGRIWPALEHQHAVPGEELPGDRDAQQPAL